MARHDNRGDTIPTMSRIPFATALVALLLPSVANAYLNPDQGSILLQLLLGGVAGVAVIARLYWRRIVSFVTRRPPPDSSIDE
jgi:hypothetical protein